MPIVTPTKATFHDNNEKNASAQYWSRLNKLRPVGDPNINLPYTRFSQERRAWCKASGLLGALPIQDGQRIVLVGGTFGWLQEQLQIFLPAATILTLDTSPWVQSAKNTDELDDINAALDGAVHSQTGKPMTLTLAERQVWIDRFLDGARAKVAIENEDLLTGDSRSRVKGTLGLTSAAKADWAISEQVLAWLDDKECVDLSKAMRQMAANVAHLTSLDMRAQYPEMPPEQEPIWNWKSLAAWKVKLTPDVIVSVHGYGTM